MSNLPFKRRDVLKASAGGFVFASVQPQGAVAEYTSGNPISMVEEPSINAGELWLEPTAVEGDGDWPDLYVTVENATTVHVEATYEYNDSTATDTIELTPDGADTYSGEIALEHTPAPGTWVDVTVHAGNQTVSRYDNEYILETDDIGFHVFEDVMDGALVYARFDTDDEGAPTDTELEELRRWTRARKHDVNYFYGSGRGSMGAVGFNLSHGDGNGIERVFDNGGDLYELDQDRAHYEEYNPWLGDDDGIDTFLDDLHAVAADDIDFDQYEFWIGMHRTGTVAGAIGRAFSDGRVYVPHLRTSESSYGTLLHGLGHMYGLHHFDQYATGALSDTDGSRGTNGCCLMDSGSRIGSGQSETFHLETPPLSVPQRIADYLDFQSEWNIGEDVQDWLLPVSSDTAELTASGLELTVPSLKALHHVDSQKSPFEAYLVEKEDVTLYRPGPGRSVAGDVRYVLESRALFDVVDGAERWLPPGDAGGGAVVYRWQEQTIAQDAEGAVIEVDEPSLNTVTDDTADRIALTDPADGDEHGDRATDITGIDEEIEYVFELTDKHDDGGDSVESFEAAIEVRPRPGDPNTTTLKLHDTVTVPEQVELDGLVDITRPSLHLKAIDDQGRVVGPNDDGVFVNEIPAAKASGTRFGAIEWISVPNDLDVEFVVSSDAIDEFLREIKIEGASLQINEQLAAHLGARMVSEYQTAETRYGDDPQLVEEDGRLAVADATTRIQRDSIVPGEEHDATPTNKASDIDIVSITTGDVDEEGVRFVNNGTSPVALTDWQLESGADTFVFPAFVLDAGARVTVWTTAGQDTTTDLYWGADSSRWDPTGGRILLVDEVGETTLDAVYDEDEVITYHGSGESATAGGVDTDDAGVDDGDAENADDDGRGFGVGGALAGLGGAAYLLKKRLTHEDTISER